MKGRSQYAIILFTIYNTLLTNSRNNYCFFKLTGLSEEKSRFQVISLLTGSGFTTKEAELITQHPTRRRLAQILMILGYVGFLTGISFLVDIIKHSMSIKNLPILIIFFIFMWLILREKLLIGYLDNLIEKIILKKYSKYKSPTKMYKLVTRAKGYGVYNIVIDENSGLVGVALKDSNLKPRNMIILNIDKGNQFIGFPKRDYVLEKGDNILLYGKVEEILKTFHLNKPPKKH
ncbi:TrkA-C domain protein [Clostridium carboxidivorans P7]|uniref:TrkA-C domain protein n=1 Tax=Clostridium carboxidivorans P7 TaxID=536227 RepID=C6PV87_9CLOT|nr:TrkA C-terminal domain-containing protein [Clostridium carboxidivorans]EET86817.1 TrkA-C domain protein [Clostridium carboxidivorans P7]EFG88561.1 TrkA-C domain protein [Clostridium carboxidivorans P7]